MTTIKIINHFHLFCGAGGGAKGMNKGEARVGSMEADFRCIGGIDNDAAAIKDFDQLSGVTGTVMDLFSRAQYCAFHGREPGPDWQEATPADIHRAQGNEHPHIVFLSAPCKGFSGLLSETRSKTGKYQALNELTLRGIWLTLEANKHDPVELYVFENVPRIANRGRHLLDQIIALLRHYGYAVAETTHDCGELGGLAQSRKRFLLVARHTDKVPPFLYEPTKRPLRAVGEILGRMPMPGHAAGGPMHRIPSLQWRTWVRLAFVEAGSDWRSLNKLRVENGILADHLIVPEEMYRGALGVTEWDESSCTIGGRGFPLNGKYSIADPRFFNSDKYEPAGQYGVRKWTDTSGVITGQRSPAQGTFSVADPRRDDARDHVDGVIPWGANTGCIGGQSLPSNGKYSVADPRHHGPDKFSNQYRVVRYDDPAMAVTSAAGKGQCVADPRGVNNDSGKFKVTDWDQAAGCVIGGDSYGARAVADPRWRESADAYQTGGHYGVLPWESHSGAVSASAAHDNGRWSIADPRPMPALTDKLVAMIRSIDGTWHRPFTTLELAALQSLLEPEEYLELSGLSDSAWRERIGNAVPPAAAQAIASTMGVTLLLAASGTTFMLSSQPIWVQPIAVALSVSQP